MSTGNKIIIFILAIIITVSGIYLILRYLKNTGQDSNFNNLIVEIDSFIYSGYYNQADELIYIASKSADSPLQYKRLLKRAFEIRDYKNLEIISKTAYQKYPEDELILSVYIFVLLKSAKSEVAASILLNQDKQLVQESLYIETNIKNESYHEDVNFLYQGIDEKSVLLYRKLFKITNNRKFLLDAVLLCLEHGEFELADSILEEIVSDDLEYIKLRFLIKYDSGKLDIASEMLDLIDFGFSIQEIKLLRIDIQIRQEKYKKAQIALTEFIELYSNYSWIPYYNLIWLNSVEINSKIDTAIEECLKVFPDNRQLMLIIMKYYLEQNKDNAAISILENYLNNNESDNELEIILRELKGVNNPEYFINSVRGLVNQDPKNINASRYLAWNMFENNDIPGLQQFLNQAERAGNSGWISFFRALISAGNGKYNSALEHFKFSYESETLWESLYNLAVISEYKNDYQDAIEYYQKSENSLTNTEENMITKSMIRTELASLLYNLEDYEHSYRELKNALDQDKNNLKAWLLLNKLESM